MSRSGSHGAPHARGRGWAFLGAALVPVLLPVLGVAPALAEPGPAAPGALVSVVVSGWPGSAPAVRRDVTAVGGRVTRELPVIDGMSARVPSGRVAVLAAMPGVKAVTPDARVRFTTVDPALGYDATGDFGSLNNVTKIVGAQDSWRAGYTGKGVDVALIDSGVAPVQGLTSGNVVNGPDLSLDASNPTVQNTDTFGHGTHMASIIAGRDVAQSTPSAYADDTSHFTGVAPDARLISLKLGAADGAVDVSQAIAAINWVDQHAHDPGFSIRVLNLSFGTNSSQTAALDPLSYAAEQAWRHGIVVVVAGGNDGTSTPVLADPAINAWVLAVGASDPQGTVGTQDDRVAAFSSLGSNARHVDLVAPGVHVLGLRVPSGCLDQANPAARVGSRFFRGSGTSQAAAVTTGAMALLLQRYPALTPDGAKAQLIQASSPMSSASGRVAGQGTFNVRRAQTLAMNTTRQPGSNGTATGLGTLAGARGNAQISSNGVPLTGDQDVFGKPWQAAAWAAATADRTAWTGGTWNGSQWTGSDWTGTSWASRTWTSRTWTGADWTGTPWTSRTWTSRTWTGQGWDSRTWTGSGWSSRTWTDGSWASAAWN